MRPITISQSHLRFPLTSVLSSPAAVRLLRVLATQAQPISTTLLASQSDLSWKGASQALAGLVAQDIVKMLGSSGSHLYQMNREHPIATALAALFQAEQSRWTDLLQALRKTFRDAPEVTAAWYYGSVARKEDTSESDFDIAIVVNESSQTDVVVDAMREMVRSIEERFCVVISIVALSQTDAARLSNDSDEWWTNMTRDALPLKGESPESIAAGRAHKFIA